MPTAYAMSGRTVSAAKSRAPTRGAKRDQTGEEVAKAAEDVRMASIATSEDEDDGSMDEEAFRKFMKRSMKSIVQSTRKQEK